MALRMRDYYVETSTAEHSGAQQSIARAQDRLLIGQQGNKSSAILGIGTSSKCAAWDLLAVCFMCMYYVECTE
jgi:hypothetical protein